MPVPGAVEELLGTRVAPLPDAARGVLLAVALSGDLRTAELAAVAGPTRSTTRSTPALLLVDGDRVRASHPLLAAAAREQARAARERRELHLALAGAVADEELRALPPRARRRTARTPRSRPRIAAAAAGASARGAAPEAVQLAEHALRLTPPERAERSERLLALAAVPGDGGRARSA